MHSIPLILCLLKLAEGSAVPVTSPNLFGDTLDDFYGCPVEYDSRASYKAGDTVSLIAHGVTSIWRHIGYCDEIISPSNKPSTFPSTGHITSPFFNGNNSTSASPVITSSSPTHSNKTSGTPTLLTNSTESPTVAITSKRTIMPSTQAYVTSPVQSSSAPTTSNATTDNPVVGFTTSPTSAAIKSTNSPTVVSTENPTTSVTTETDDLVYYPDWNGENLSCLSDGNQPIYMNVDPSYYLSPELSLCCTKHYHWNYDVCVGARPGTGKWYMDYATGKCVRDCDGGDKCGGYAEDWEYLYDLKLTCCLQRKWWDILNC